METDQIYILVIYNIGTYLVIYATIIAQIINVNYNIS